MDAPSDSPKQEQSRISRDLIEANLETERAKEYSCPYCQKTFELEPLIKGDDDIIDALAQGNPYDKIIYCRNKDCVSFREDTFVCRISIDDNGTITIKTFPRESLQQELQHAIESGFMQPTDQELQQALQELQQALQELLQELPQELQELLQELPQELQELPQELQKIMFETRREIQTLHALVDYLGMEYQDLKKETKELKKCLAEIDRVTGTQRPEDRLARIQDHARIAGQMKEIQLLTGRTPDQILENARTWAEQQKQKQTPKPTKPII